VHTSIEYSKKLKKKDFQLYEERYSSNKRGKREYLKKSLGREMMKELNIYFEQKVEVKRVKWGQSQELESLLGEEAMQLARYLRSEISDWFPRIVKL